MVQPKYSPEEALKAIKLRMNYDSSKTLNENTQSLMEQDATKDANEINRQLNVVFVDEQKIVDILKKYNTTEKFKQMLSKFKEVTGKELGEALPYKLDPTRDSAEWSQLVAHLANVGYTVVLPDKAKGEKYVFKFQPTGKVVVDPKKAEVDPKKAVVNPKVQENINKTYCNSKDGIIQFGQLKGKRWDSFVEFYKLTPEQVSIAKKSCGKDTPDAGGSLKKPSGSTGKAKYTPCEAGKYVRGCKSETVKKVQACLEMPAKYHTGNFGPITQGELQKKFPDLAKGFTDKDVDVICKKTTKTVTTPDEDEVFDLYNA